MRSLSIVTQDIIETIQRLTAEDRLPPLMLYGPPGTGKTSLIKALAAHTSGIRRQALWFQPIIVTRLSRVRCRSFQKMI